MKLSFAPTTTSEFKLKSCTTALVRGLCMLLIITKFKIHIFTLIYSIDLCTSLYHANYSVVENTRMCGLFFSCLVNKQTRDAAILKLNIKRKLVLKGLIIVVGKKNILLRNKIVVKITTNEHAKR
jgi:hypothetical protein